VTAPSDLESIFKKASDTYGVSEDLLKAVAKAESNFNTNSTSSAGAMGVMQLMPSTAAQLGVTDAYDAEQNIMGGAKLLSQLLNKYDGDTSLALAAYNAGSGNVDKYGGIPPFTETQNYVSKILGYLNDGNIEVPNTAYASSDSSDVTTIYAVAANDASNNGPSIYTINAEPLL
jgi:soluble lytic murein transglycosylase-like protein